MLADALLADLCSEELAVFIWAFVGIAVKHTGTPVVASAALIAAGVAVVAMAFGVLLDRSNRLLFRETM